MATLTTMIGRVRAVLVDSGGLLWSDGTVTEGIRLALGEYGLASGGPAQLEGLDGAAASNLPAGHESLAVWGAAGYAALARAVDRADNAQLGTEASALQGWGEARLKEYKVMLGSAFAGYLAGLAAEEAGVDPAELAAKVALLTAQAGLADAQVLKAAAESALAEAQAAACAGQEARAEAAAAAETAAKAAEAARLAELRGSAASPWGSWSDSRDIGYPDGYERT